MIADTNAIRQTAELAKRRPQAPLFVVFEGSPGPGNECVFVEVEDEAGNGCGFAWRERSDGRWALGPFYPAP